MVSVSNDGMTWHTVSDDKFRELLADESADCWVDVKDAGGFHHVALSLIRKWQKDPRPRDPGLADLFGLPVIEEA